MDTEKNIVEKYVEVRGQFIILISGLPGSGKLKLGKNIARDFKFELINQYDYYKEDYDEKVTLSSPDKTENVTMVNWYTDLAIDWARFNSDIVRHKFGAVVIGVSLPESKITMQADFHINLSITKQMSLEKMKEYIEENKEKYPEEYKILGTPMEKLKMNKLIFPYYLETVKLAKIDKYITVGDEPSSEDNEGHVYDVAFEMIIKFVQKFLDDFAKGKLEWSIKSEMEVYDEPVSSYDDELDMIKKYDDSDSSDSDSESDSSE